MMPEWRVEYGERKTLAQQREAAHRLLCNLLGEEVVIEHDEKGAPYLPAHPELSVSISHCRAAVAVAVSSNNAVGIDIECRRRVSQSLVERVCTEEEQKAICNAVDPEMEFLRYWTRKEAVLKMHRTGIQGFGSMLLALVIKDCTVEDVDCGRPDIVAAVACVKV